MTDVLFALTVACVIALLIIGVLYRRAERAENGVATLRALLENEERAHRIHYRETRRAHAALDYARQRQDADAFIDAFRRDEDLHERWPDFDEPIYSSAASLVRCPWPHYASTSVTSVGDGHAVLGDVFARHNDEEGVR